MFKLISYLILALVATTSASAQQIQKLKPQNIQSNYIQPSSRGMCGLDLSLRGLRTNADYKASEAKMNQDILNYQRNTNIDSITVPVVFHIINNDPSSVSDAVILKALKDLNNAFSKRGNYAGSLGADTKIRFCLSQKDPDGGITTGIARTTSFFSTHLNPEIEDARLKNLIQWDPSRYINIWYVSSIDKEGFADFACGRWTRTNVGGYATLPLGGGPLDGIVVTDFGILLAHEMGHYLGLYHTFEGLNCINNNCATDGDLVCDTPPDRSMINSTSCSNPENSCDTDTLSNHSNGNFTTDVPDQISNFMDYGNNACHNQFTQGQADRMNAAINTQRSGLLQNQCDKPCNENINAAFVRDNAFPANGDVVNFTNNSTGAIKYQWLIDNVVISDSTNFTFIFTTAGKFKVTLKAYNTISCYAMYSDFVIVNCGVTARFYTDKKIIASNSIYTDSIRFTNTSINATNFTWLISNDLGMAEQAVSTHKDLVYRFNTPANYFIKLIASNGTCTDTTLSYSVPVSEPTQDGVAFITMANCYQQTKVKVQLSVCNFGYATIPAGTPISFYDADPLIPGAHKLDATFYLPDSILGVCCSVLYTHVIDAQQSKLNTIFVVFNDSGNVQPLVFPNTSLIEKNYANNIRVATNFSFRANIVPNQTVLEPGDTLQLRANAIPDAIRTYLWSTSNKLSCTTCKSPYLIADSDRVKQVIVTSQYGCFDTAYIDIKVPPAYDYTVLINDIQCAANNKLYVNFTLENSFKRGVIPKGLMVSFYDADPSTSAAHLLSPVFFVTDTAFSKKFTYTTIINDIPAGKIYAVVNDSGNVVPVKLPDNLIFPEKNYLNNIDSYGYQQQIVSLQPQDSIVFRNTFFPIKINTPIYNAASTQWFKGNGYKLDCIQCASPVVTVFDSSKVRMQTENKYGCIIKGTAVIKVFPPDFTIQINENNCYTNNTTLVKFQICINNNYDSIYGGLPVSFYDGPRANGNANLLATTFYTPKFQLGNCYNYQHIIATPSTGKLVAVVNDKGTTNSAEANKIFNETNFGNNTSSVDINDFTVTIVPADTAIARLTTLQLVPKIKGGVLSAYHWVSDPFLSCTNCLSPVITPPYTKTYKLIAQNEYGCIDTAVSIVKIFTGGTLNIPSGFSPNNDNLNDIFYILAGNGINTIQSFLIFDRWGVKVFENGNFMPNDPRYGWDGNNKGVQAAAGTYVYVISFIDIDGKSKTYKGTILLLR